MFLCWILLFATMSSYVAAKSGDFKTSGKPVDWKTIHAERSLARNGPVARFEFTGLGDKVLLDSTSVRPRTFRANRNRYTIQALKSVEKAAPASDEFKQGVDKACKEQVGKLLYAAADFTHEGMGFWDCLQTRGYAKIDNCLREEFLQKLEDETSQLVGPPNIKGMQGY